MNTKKIRRQCMVPGCRNYDTYMIHKTRDPWPTVIMCKECVVDAYFSLLPEKVVAPPEEKKVEIKQENVEKIKEISAAKTKSSGERTTKKATGK